MMQNAAQDQVTIVGLTGRAGSGKSAAAEYLVRRYGFLAVSFAGPLKSMLETMLVEASIDYFYLHEPKLKNEPIGELLGLSARTLMQRLGTEWGRALHPDLWVHLLERNVGLPDAPVHDRIVITDVRFPNECAWLRKHDGVLIRLHREQAVPVSEHASEAWIAELHADVDLVNNGPTLAGLHSLLDGAMADRDIDPRDEAHPELF